MKIIPCNSLIVNSVNSPLAGAGIYYRKKGVGKLTINYEMIIGGLLMLSVWALKELYGYFKTRQSADYGDFDERIKSYEDSLHTSILNLNVKISELIEKFDKFFIDVQVRSVMWNENTGKIKVLEQDVRKLEKSVLMLAEKINSWENRK